MTALKHPEGGKQTDFGNEQQFVAELKRYVTENLVLSNMTDENIEEKIDDVVAEGLGNQYCPIV